MVLLHCINRIKFEVDNYDKIEILSSNIKEYGKTLVQINYKTRKLDSMFELNKKRNINRKLIEKLKKSDISSIIN